MILGVVDSRNGWNSMWRDWTQVAISLIRSESAHGEGNDGDSAVPIGLPGESSRRSDAGCMERSQLFRTHGSIIGVLHQSRLSRIRSWLFHRERSLQQTIQIDEPVLIFFSLILFVCLFFFCIFFVFKCKPIQWRAIFSARLVYIFLWERDAIAVDDDRWHCPHRQSIWYQFFLSFFSFLFFFLFLLLKCLMSDSCLDAWRIFKDVNQFRSRALRDGWGPESLPACNWHDSPGVIDTHGWKLLITN